jgi:hypothetical protein
MTSVDAALLTRLEAEAAAEDQRLARGVGPLRSLCPGRERATPLAALVKQTEVPASSLASWVDAVLGLARAQAEHFPENVFWDLDYAARCLWTDARERPDPAAALQETKALLVELYRLFGRQEAIQFRYAHDFVYGFDWAKWVRGDPRRAVHGPFSLPFLRYIEGRGHEFLRRIAAGDDPTYAPLPAGQARNPFVFSREPADEARLHEDLAARGWVPVRTWCSEHAPRWELDFQVLRAESAAALGIPCKANE